MPCLKITEKQELWIFRDWFICGLVKRIILRGNKESTRFHHTHMAIKVFITDDHYMVIEGIRSLLQHEKGIEWMGHATSAASCLAFLGQEQPDVILMDINLPDQSGIDLCKEVKQKYPAVFILGLSTFNQQSFIEKMLNNGASGYVLK
jgi:DNA-binding NarL/FixJ family response regulator